MSSSSKTKSAPLSSEFKKIQNRGKGKRPATVVKGKEKTKVADKGKSFLYNVSTHCKRNYPKYLAEKKNEKEGKYDLLVLETCVVENNQNAWILDSRATSHVCSSLKKTNSFKHVKSSNL